MPQAPDAPGSSTQLGYRWAPIIGEFDTQDDSVIFQGREIASPQYSGPSMGVVMSNQRFSGGTVSACVEFNEVASYSACSIVLNHNPQTRAMLTAGIGGGSMFTIMQSDGQTWKPLATTGEGANLKPRKRYQLEATLRGSSVALRVDGVDVLLTQLASPLNLSQVGLYFLDSTDVTVSAFFVSTQRPKAFVIMQFGTPFDDVYTQVIQAVCKEFDLEVVRADEIYGPGLIIRDIVQSINEAAVVVAEISPQNANVYFEVGYAYAWSKPMILLAEKNTKLPFDVSPFRTLFYENSIAGKARVEEGLRRHLSAILADTFPRSN